MAGGVGQRGVAGWPHYDNIFNPISESANYLSGRFFGVPGAIESNYEASSDGSHLRPHFYASLKLLNLSSSAQLLLAFAGVYSKAN